MTGASNKTFSPFKKIEQEDKSFNSTLQFSGTSKYLKKSNSEARQLYKRISEFDKEMPKE